MSASDRPASYPPIGANGIVDEHVILEQKHLRISLSAANQTLAGVATFEFI
jgi:hypothetical protein